MMRNKRKIGWVQWLACLCCLCLSLTLLPAPSSASLLGGPSVGLNELIPGRTVQFSGRNWLLLDPDTGLLLLEDYVFGGVQKPWGTAPAFDINDAGSTAEYVSGDFADALHDPDNFILQYDWDTGEYGSPSFAYSGNVGLLSKDEYIAYQSLISASQNEWYLLTPEAGGINYVQTDGATAVKTSGLDTDLLYVRPALHLESDTPVANSDGIYLVQERPALSCQEVKDKHPSASDGTYTISAQGHTFDVYCADMDSAPKEYLELVHTGLWDNYSSYAGGGASPGPGLKTTFTKLRFDPVTFLVDTGDFTFSESSGYVYHSGENDKREKVAYGVARACTGGYPPQGKANLNLTGTPFSVAPDQFAYNELGSGTADYYHFNQLVDVAGDGYCGWVAPKIPGTGQPAYEAVGGPFLQLEYAGFVYEPTYLTNLSYSETSLAVEGRSYSLSVDNSEYELTLQYELSEYGTVYVSGTNSQGQAMTTDVGDETITIENLTVGRNNVQLEIANEFGASLYYDLTIDRLPESDGSPDYVLMESLQYQGQQLEPVNYTYSLQVDAAVDHMHLQYALTDAGAMTVTGHNSQGDPISANVSADELEISGLTPGVNYMTLLVAGENGSETYYSLTIVRNWEQPIQLGLSLFYREQPLTPMSNMYFLQVDTEAESVMLEYALTAQGTITITGNNSQYQSVDAEVGEGTLTLRNLTIGYNSIVIQVVGEQEQHHYYFLTLHRKGAGITPAGPVYATKQFWQDTGYNLVFSKPLAAILDASKIKVFVNGSPRTVNASLMMGMLKLELNEIIGSSEQVVVIVSPGAVADQEGIANPQSVLLYPNQFLLEEPSVSIASVMNGVQHLIDYDQDGVIGREDVVYLLRLVPPRFVQ